MPFLVYQSALQERRRPKDERPILRAPLNSLPHNSYATYMVMRSVISKMRCPGFHNAREQSNCSRSVDTVCFLLQVQREKEAVYEVGWGKSKAFDRS